MQNEKQNLNAEELQIMLNAKEGLYCELEKGRRSGEQEGWLDAECVFSELFAKYED